MSHLLQTYYVARVRPYPGARVRVQVAISVDGLGSGTLEWPLQVTAHNEQEARALYRELKASGVHTMLERIAAALEQIAASLVPLAVCAERETFIYELEQRLAERTHN